MKKRIVLGLVLLASLSMLVASMAHAQEASVDAQAQCSTQASDALQAMINNTQALLTVAADQDSRDLLQAQLAELVREKQATDAQLDGCN